MQDESFAEIAARVHREVEEEEVRREAAQAEYDRKRREYRMAMFGTDDPIAMQKPLPVEDFDGMLRVQAAQLRNLVHSLMAEAMYDGDPVSKRAPALYALTRMVQTNVYIARTLAKSADSKTVRGVSTLRDPQD